MAHSKIELLNFLIFYSLEINYEWITELISKDDFEDTTGHEALDPIDHLKNDLASLVAAKKLIIEM